jgi:hypothetical protein
MKGSMNAFQKREWNGRDAKIRSVGHAEKGGNGGWPSSENGTYGGAGIYGTIGRTWRLGMDFAPIRLHPEPPSKPADVICIEQPVRSHRLRCGNIGAPIDCRNYEGKPGINDHMAFAETILNTYL